ncbi:MAG: ABC transporter permease [Planctomycetota bacterium]
MGTLYQDIRFGIRMMVKNPGFSLPAILCLGLGIGACTAILSVVNAVLLRPLPYTDSERLVAINEHNLERDRGSGISPRLALDMREEVESFEDVGFLSSASFHLLAGEFPEQVGAARVSPNLFKLQGAKPLHGRIFLPDEDQPDKSHVALISHSLWQRRFGGDPNLVGKTITCTDMRPRLISWGGDDIKNKVYTVVGIMPPKFAPCMNVARGDMWVPLAFHPDEMDNRQARPLQTVGRLKAGVTLPKARAELDLLSRGLAEKYPASNKGWTIRLRPLRETFVGGTRQSVLMLAGAVAFVLLIGCANVANMLLARAAGRQKEMAVRMSLGAGRWRVTRQLLTESLLLALFGAGLGLLLTHWSVGLLKPLIPRNWEIGMDVRMFGFTLAILVASGVGCGLAPAWQSSGTNLTDALKEGAGHSVATSGRRHGGDFLVVSQVAMALVLLIGAGLMIQTLVRLLRVDPGFDPRNLSEFKVKLPLSRYGGLDGQMRLFSEQLLERLRCLPGVESVGAVTGRGGSSPCTAEGQTTPVQMTQCSCSIGTCDYLGAMGIPLLQGRYLTDEDATSGDNSVVINEIAARQLWPGENPIGKRINYGRERFLTVVGVVKPIRLWSYAYEAGPEFYVPYKKAEDLGRAMPTRADFVMRSTGDPLSLVKAVRREVAALDSQIPVEGFTRVQDRLRRSTARRRLYVQLLTSFAYSVSRRTHEIGIRTALGAERSDVFKLVVKKGLILIVVGLVIGVAGALALTHVLRSLLFGVTPTDPMTFVAVSLLLMVVGLVACYIPARRATRIDPMSALRYE